MMAKTKIQKIRENLLNDKRFFQTGSRYWNNKHPIIVPIENNTDWDFVCEYSLDIEVALIKIGFVPNSKVDKNLGNYGDGETVEVLFYGSKDEVGGQVQVIFKKNVELYVKIFDSVGVMFYVNYLWKKNTPRDLIMLTLKHLYDIEAKRNERDIDIFGNDPDIGWDL